MIGKAVDQISGSCVEGVHESASVYKNSPVRMIGAFPVIGPTAPNAAGSAASTESVHPEFFSRGCVQRNQSALSSRYIRDVPDHKRTKAKTTDLTRVVGPGNFQLVDIFGSNLLEGGIVRAVRTAQVICPTDGRLLAVTDWNR